MKLIPIILPSVLLCLITSFSRGEDWPGWLGPNQYGISTESLPPIKDLKELWRGEVGIGNASVAIANGSAISLGYDGRNAETVFCFDAATGKRNWNYSYPAALMPNLHTGGPNATPLIVGDKVFTLSKDGRALCLSLKLGEVIWEKQLTKALETKVPTWGFGSSPVLKNGQLVFTAGRTVSLNPDNGETQWRSVNLYKHGYSSVTFSKSGEREVIIAMDGAGVSFAQSK